MKKFFYVAMVAVAAFMVSCTKTDGFGDSDYYKNHKLDFDMEAGTVNGHEYDNTTDKCWEIVTKAKMGIISTTVTTYEWGTQFTVVLSNETAIAMLSGATKTTYTMKEASQYDDYEKCADANAAAKNN